MLLVCELTLKCLWHSFGRSLESRDVLVNRSATPGSIREQQIFQMIWGFTFSITSKGRANWLPVFY